MKKVLLICGSNRDGYSYKILKEIDNKLDNTELVKLRDYNIEFCKGCLYCNDHPKCVINDDLDTIVNKMLSSDIIVFAIPNYFGGMGGFFKNFVDRFHYMYKRDTLSDKEFIFIYTGALDDDSITMEQLTKSTYHLEKYLKWNVVNRYSFSSSKELDLDKINEIIKFLSK